MPLPSTSAPTSPPRPRTRPDRCPGVLRPWPADDGALVRVRLAGGEVSCTALAALSNLAVRYGDARIHLTTRANLQLRALPRDGDRLPDEVIGALENTGLLPSRRHDVARNLMCSPLTGVSGGRLDLRPVVRELDARLCAEPRFEDLPGRFLFLLDDGRGDLVDHSSDLGAVALDADRAQLRVGSQWGEVVAWSAVPQILLALAAEFLHERGVGPTAAWHVHELDTVLRSPRPADSRLPGAAPRPPYGALDGAEHVPVPDGVLTTDLVADLVRHRRSLIVTPWRSVLVLAS